MKPPAMVSTRIATITSDDLGGQALPHVAPEGKLHWFLPHRDQQVTAV